MSLRSAVSCLLALALLISLPAEAKSKRRKAPKGSRMTAEKELGADLVYSAFPLPDGTSCAVTIRNASKKKIAFMEFWVGAMSVKSHRYVERPGRLQDFKPGAQRGGYPFVAETPDCEAVQVRLGQIRY